MFGDSHDAETTRPIQTEWFDGIGRGERRPITGSRRLVVHWAATAVIVVIAIIMISAPAAHIVF